MKVLAKHKRVNIILRDGGKYYKIGINRNKRKSIEEYELIALGV